VIAREIWKRRKAPGARTNKRKSMADTDDSSAEALDAKISNVTYMTSVRNNLSKDISGQELKSSTQPRQLIFVIPTTATMTNNDRCNERQRRQMRMFKVILILMCVFIVCRLPNWIFLFCKLNFTLQERWLWLITYSLGILGIVNSMANPFLYTFLGEAIRFTARIQNACYKFCNLCRPKAENYANNETMCVQNALSMPKADNGGVYLGN
jgi:7 transmembrane receptor (rhodopsin family)